MVMLTDILYTYVATVVNYWHYITSYTVPSYTLILVNTYVLNFEVSCKL